MAFSRWFLKFRGGRSPLVWRWVGLSLLLVVGLGMAIAASQIRFAQLFQPLQAFVFGLEDLYQPWFAQHSTQSPWLLLPLAFLGGLLASLSPCILCLLPINLGYIGTRDITSRKDALVKATAFVLGVATTLSVIGLFSSLAGAIAFQYRGYLNLAIGGLILIMGLSLLELISLNLPSLGDRLPIANPYSFGLTFALVTSPCASPIMFAVIAAAGATGSQVYSILAMMSYALGYTAILFFASVFTGLAKQARTLLTYSSQLLRLGGGLLLLIGAYYIASGIQWILLTQS